MYAEATLPIANVGVATGQPERPTQEVPVQTYDNLGKLAVSLKKTYDYPTTPRFHF